MITLVLAVLGLVAGSFVNALVWRLHERAHEAAKKRPNRSYINRLSVSRGRSMCPNCHHQLMAKDLLPLVSWLSLKGRCRYCHAPISRQYPLVEAATAFLFVFSYICWPMALQGRGLMEFVLWLLFLTGFTALTVYDLKWYVLPDRIVYPLIGLAVLQTLIVLVFYGHSWLFAAASFWGLLIGGGLFYILFQVSQGRWIGGGDVKLGAALGILLGGPLASLELLFIASVSGTLASLPLLLIRRLRRDSQIPFGPFLILAAIIVELFGVQIAAWLRRHYFIPYQTS